MPSQPSQLYLRELVLRPVNHLDQGESEEWVKKKTDITISTLFFREKNGEKGTASQLNTFAQERCATMHSADLPCLGMRWVISSRQIKPNELKGVQDCQEGNRTSFYFQEC